MSGDQKLGHKMGGFFKKKDTGFERSTKDRGW